MFSILSYSTFFQILKYIPDTETQYDEVEGKGGIHFLTGSQAPKKPY